MSPATPLTSGSGLLERIEQLCSFAAGRAGDHPAAATAQRLRSRLHEPLRVAIAGRVNAGKSTLLNALVGERLAATDASECTRVVTWYRHAIGYQVEALTGTGSTQTLSFTRTDGELDIDLGDLQPGDIERIEVGWPAARLEALTLIDTPGLEGTREAASTATLRLLGAEAAEESEVDAVIYLMRHLHHHDLRYLETFRDTTLPLPSPANSIAVLSRADEIGAGRLDAMASAAAVADRYATDRRLRSLCTTVVPVAGLLAETAATLREDEAVALRQMASLPENELTDTLLSVDRFCEPHLSRLPSATRRELLIRLGLFGVRRCIEALGRTPEMTATDLARLLRDVSGIGTLVQLLDTHFATRARALKAQSAVVGLRRLARSLKETDPDAALTIEASAEELWTTAHDFSLLRLIQIIAADPQIIDDEEADEVRRLTSGGSFADRLGTQQGVPTDRLLEVAAGRINHWRERAGHPLIEQPAAEACDLIIRAYEAIHTEIADNGE